MRPSIALGLILGAALSASALGCRDLEPTEPQQTLDNRSGSGGREGDGSDSTTPPPPPVGHAPATPSTPSDTAVGPRPPASRPASFNLTGLVFRAQDGVDTTRLVAASGVTASLHRVKAADGTPIQPEVFVGSAVTNALGEVVFRDLASAYYRIDVKASVGGQLLEGSRTIEPPPAKEIAVLIILRRKP